MKYPSMKKRVLHSFTMCVCCSNSAQTVSLGVFGVSYQTPTYPPQLKSLASARNLQQHNCLLQVNQRSGDVQPAHSIQAQPSPCIELRNSWSLYFRFLWLGKALDLLGSKHGSLGLVQQACLINELNLSSLVSLSRSDNSNTFRGLLYWLLWPS